MPAHFVYEGCDHVILFHDALFLRQILNEEDGGIHRRHASPSIRDRSSQMSSKPQTSSYATIPGYGTSAIVAMDRTSSLPASKSLSSGLLLSQAKKLSKGSDRSLESVLHASKEKVSAIESMLRGLEMSEKHNPSAIRSSSLDLGIASVCSLLPFSE